MHAVCGVRLFEVLSRLIVAMWPDSLSVRWQHLLKAEIGKKDGEADCDSEVQYRHVEGRGGAGFAACLRISILTRCCRNAEEYGAINTLLQMQSIFSDTRDGRKNRPRP